MLNTNTKYTQLNLFEPIEIKEKIDYTMHSIECACVGKCYYGKTQECKHGPRTWTKMKWNNITKKYQIDK